MNTKEFKTMPKELSPCHFAMDISIPVQEVNSAIIDVERKYVNSVRIPGFRVGKTPVNLIKKRFYGKIREEVKQELIRGGLQTAMLRSENKPVTLPTFTTENISDVQEDTEFTFTIEFDVAPKVELPEYKNIQLKALEKKTGSEEIDKVIEKLLTESATFEKVDRPSKAGDMIKLSYTSAPFTKEELPDSLVPLLFNEETWILLEGNEIIPGIQEGLQGAQAGEEISLKVDFPKNFRENVIAGKTVSYTFKIYEIHGKILPDLNDEVAKKFGAEDENDLRSSIEKKLEEQFEHQNFLHLQQQISDYLVENSDFPLPPNLLEMEKQYSKQDALEDWIRLGKSIEDIGNEKEEFEKIVAQTATNRLKLQYIISEIANRENILIPDSEVNSRLEFVHQQIKAGRNPKANQNMDDEVLKSKIKLTLLMEKVSKKLIQNAKIN